MRAAGSPREGACFGSHDAPREHDEPGAAGAIASVSCLGCGRRYAMDAWRALPAVSTLSGADVRQHLLDWPPGWRVEVRACGGCGRRMARTARG
jgi:hypothetical protein